ALSAASCEVQVIGPAGFGRREALNTLDLVVLARERGNSAQLIVIGFVGGLGFVVQVVEFHYLVAGLLGDDLLRGGVRHRQTRVARCGGRAITDVAVDLRNRLRLVDGAETDRERPSAGAGALQNDSGAARD